jgi:hypothetical protein
MLSPSPIREGEDAPGRRGRAGVQVARPFMHIPRMCGRVGVCCCGTGQRRRRRRPSSGEARGSLLYRSPFEVIVHFGLPYSCSDPSPGGTKKKKLNEFKSFSWNALAPRKRPDANMLSDANVLPSTHTALQPNKE